jgi:uncharacterized membrane protein YciS (DUF1049 family)
VAEACFSVGAIAILTAVGGVLGTVIATLFWTLIKTLQESNREARAERDRAATNLESALQIGEKAVAPPSRRR